MCSSQSIIDNEVPVFNHVWVDGQLGNDQTGKVRDMSKPFQTIQAAVSAIGKTTAGSQNWWKVCIAASEYNERIIYDNPANGVQGVVFEYAPNATHVNPNTADRNIIETVTISNAGSGLTDGVYLNVDLLGGTGNDQQATVTVSGNVVTDVEIRGYFAEGYTLGDTLTVDLPGNVQAEVDVATLMNDIALYNLRLGGGVSFYATGPGKLINENPNGTLDAQSFSQPNYDGLLELSNVSGQAMFNAARLLVKNIQLIRNDNGYIYNRNDSVRIENCRSIEHNALTGAFNAGNGSVIFRNCPNMLFAGPINANEGFTTNYIFQNCNVTCDAEITLQCRRAVYIIDNTRIQNTFDGPNARIIRITQPGASWSIQGASVLVMDDAADFVMESPVRSVAITALSNFYSNKNVPVSVIESVRIEVSAVDPAGGDEFSIIILGDTVSYTSLPGDTINDVLTALKTEVENASAIAGNGFEIVAGFDPTWFTTNAVISGNSLIINGNPANRTERFTTSANGSYHSLVNNTGNSAMNSIRDQGNNFWIPFGPHNLTVTPVAGNIPFNQNYQFN